MKKIKVSNLLLVLSFLMLCSCTKFETSNNKSTNLTSESSPNNNDTSNADRQSIPHANSENNNINSTNQTTSTTPEPQARTPQSISVAETDITPAALKKAFKTISLRLSAKTPSESDWEKLTNKENFDLLIDDLIESQEFIEKMQTYHQEYFEMPANNADINYREPSNLAAYLIKENIDFRKIVTADYCVNDELEKIPCDAFSSDEDTKKYAAGVLTTRGFLTEFAAAYNFKRTAKSFSFFSCSEYPDLDDPGLPRELVSAKSKEFNSITATPKCYNCHSTMNPRASLFYNFDISGKFSLNPDNIEDAKKTRDDANEISHIDDLIIPGTKPVYNGIEVNNLREYALDMVSDEKFVNCQSKRIINYLLGASHKSRLSEQLDFSYDEFKKAEFKIKPYLKSVLKNPALIISIGI